MSLPHRLILVEGLTGSGKSNTAQFLCRQLSKNNLDARWFHEADLDHPLTYDLDTIPDSEVLDHIRKNWQSFLKDFPFDQTICILEASYFNNLFENLFIRNFNTDRILSFADDLNKLTLHLQPLLIYLNPKNPHHALEKNFANRGKSFQNFVIEFVEQTQYAQVNQLKGLNGCFRFWQTFSLLTDQLYESFPSKKIQLDSNDMPWNEIESQLMTLLNLDLIPYSKLAPQLTETYCGEYQDQGNGKKFEIIIKDGWLLTNWIHNTFTRLIPSGENQFIVAGWHFMLQFRNDSREDHIEIEIAGKDVDYMRMVGHRAEKLM